jgi:hypothetical protein
MLDVRGAEDLAADACSFLNALGIGQSGHRASSFS